MATTSSFFSLLDHNNLDVRSSFPSFSSRRSYDFSPQILQTWIFSFLCTRTVLEREIRWYHQSSSSSLWRSWEREEEVPLSKSQGCFIPLWSLLWVMRHSNSSSLLSFFLPSFFFLSLSSPLWLLSLCLCCSWLDPFICSLVEFAGKLIVLDGYTLFHFSFCLDFRVSLVLFLFPFVEDVCYTPLSASF